MKIIFNSVSTANGVFYLSNRKEFLALNVLHRKADITA